MSPTNQNLSYNQQQQIHRTGGLQRLTADLAGLQFNDAEAVFKNYAQYRQTPQLATGTPQVAGTGGASAAGAGNSGAQRGTAAAAGAAVISQTTRSPIQTSSKRKNSSGAVQQQQQRHCASHEVNAGKGYEEQMVVSSNGSQGSDYDPVKDAQETAEDVALMRRHKILHLVGTGNYARVYKSLANNGKEVAIKSINLSRTSDNYKFKFLPRELNTLKKLNHPHICRTYEIIHFADRVFIVMQFCSNGTIADLLHRIGPFSEPLARTLFSPVIEAVSYMHSIEYAHRDLKVENILLDSDFNPKLTDFSYSICTTTMGAGGGQEQNKHQTNATTTTTNTNTAAPTTTTKSSYRSIGSKHANHPLQSNKHHQQHQQQTASPSRGGGGGPIRLNETFCGTLPYLSPEMIRQRPYDAKKTDVWSLGICLYVMLNDRLPYPFNDIKSMIKKQMTKDYKFKNNLEFSDQIKDLMAQILEPDYTRRPGVFELGKHVWFNGPRERPT